MSIVVAVQIDDYVRLFGGFRERASADEFAARVNAKVEKIEDAEWPGGYGRARALYIHSPRQKDALAFALGKMD